MRGAFGGYTKTLGEIDINEKELNGVKLTLHVVGDDTSLPADGVLGRDNIWNSSVINARERQLVFFNSKNTEILRCPLMSVNNINQCQKKKKENNVILARTMQPVKIKVYTNIKEIIIHKESI